MKLQIKPLKLPDRYIPNTSDHIRLHGHNPEKNDAFTSDVDELSIGTVIQIPEISNDLKILLLIHHLLHQNRYKHKRNLLLIERL